MLGYGVLRGIDGILHIIGDIIRDGGIIIIAGHMTGTGIVAIDIITIIIGVLIIMVITHIMVIMSCIVVFPVEIMQRIIHLGHLTKEMLV